MATQSTKSVLPTEIHETKQHNEGNAESSRPLEQRTGKIGRFFLLYAYPFFKFAYSRRAELNANDLPPLPEAIHPHTTGAQLKEIWKTEKENAEKMNTQPSLGRAIWILLREHVIKTLTFIWIATLFNLLVPLMSGGVVKAVSHDLPDPLAYALIPGVCVMSFLGIFCTQLAFLSQGRAAVAAWGGLTTLVVEHPSRMTLAERGRFSEGEILNLASTDCQVVMDVLVFSAFYSVMPLQTVLCVIILFILLGPSFCVGLGMICINIFCGEKLAAYIKKRQVLKNKASDSRNMLLNESFQGIRTVKLYSSKFEIQPFVVGGFSFPFPD
eukprot:c12398_g2_i1.p1 GENE.c12398_g2_i1~~c12398_g2_i1.p1  ORF type:complete len:326 (-),score=62.72 c12398_g2_i1:471-1448(-)